VTTPDAGRHVPPGGALGLTVIVDSEERISAFLPEVEDLVTEGLVVVDDVRVVRHVSRGPDA
jgi:hypothetical protein